MYVTLMSLMYDRSRKLGLLQGSDDNMVSTRLSSKITLQVPFPKSDKYRKFIAGSYPLEWTEPRVTVYFQGSALP